MLYTHVAAGILGAVVAATGAWQVQAWRIAGIQGKHAEAVATAVGDARREEQRLRKGVENALEQANIKARANAVSADRARDERDGLRDQIAASNTNVPNATRSALNQYAVTLGGLFDQCVREYQGLAVKADGHALDARTLNDAWPR